MPVWSESDTVLTCVRDTRSRLPVWTWVFVALGAALVLAAAAAVFLGSRWALFRLRWMREVDLKRKRGTGPPKGGGPLTVVVTDIDGYSSARRPPGGRGSAAASQAERPRRPRLATPPRARPRRRPGCRMAAPTAG